MRALREETLESLGANPFPLMVMDDPQANLFEVKGRSAEPIALNGQFLITRPVRPAGYAIRRLDKRLVVAIDKAGARYFKRLHVKTPLALTQPNHSLSYRSCWKWSAFSSNCRRLN